MSFFSFLDKDRAVASPGFNRWLVPPAALAIHLAIGQVYAFSVFKIPLTRVLGVTHSTAGDWTFPQLAWIFSIAIVMLGLSAAVFGRWLENAGPRKAMFVSACCFGGGFLIAALGVHLHLLALVYLGYGGLGGIGLGLGYISPVSTLIKWFSDRPGLATGLAIMGFGGGAMVGGPLSNLLMNLFRTPTSNGVALTFIAMGLIYFTFMMFGVFVVRTPPAGYQTTVRASAVGAVPSHESAIAVANVDVETAFRSRQFWLLWIVLCTNVTAGIGILEQASPMIQEMFKGRFGNTTTAAATAVGFVGLLSLFNMLGRFVWSSTSDYIGRKATYCIFFLLGMTLYVAITFTGQSHLNNVALFVAFACVIISMYGGGFATIPAYLRDIFGTMHVSAIHGRLLTAWSVAGVLGPVLVNNLREHQVSQGTAVANAYSTTLYVMAGLLCVGLIANLLVSPLRTVNSEALPIAEPTPDRLRSIPTPPSKVGH